MLNAAIAAHPKVWRERYADEVRGTLMDVADDRGGRVPLSETLPLALRGLWMRARGSLAFWGGLAIVAIFVVNASTVTFDPDGSLTARAQLLNSAIGSSALVLALVSGWEAAMSRATSSVGARGRLGSFATMVSLLLSVTAIGYLVAFIVLAVRFGAPWPAWPAPLMLVGQFALALAAIAIGALLGAVLPRVVVIFAAPLAAIATFMLLFTLPTGWNLAPWGMYSGVAYITDPEPFIRGYAIAAVIVAAAVLAVAASSVWLRAGVVGAMVVTAAVGASAQTPNREYEEPTPRSQSELVCSTDQPLVCLWPEQEAAFGALYREQIGAAYVTAREHGLPVDEPAPRSVAQFALTGIGAVEGISGDDLSEYGLGISGIRPNDVIELYASSMTAGFIVKPLTGTGEAPSLQHSIAVVLGVPADETWMVKPDPFTGDTFLDPASAPNETEARALVERWLTDGVDGVRAPS